MKEERKEESKLICIRCGGSAENSGCPNLCPKCARQMESLAKKLGSSVDVRVWFMEDKKVEWILRQVRSDCLKTLQVILEIEKEMSK